MKKKTIRKTQKKNQSILSKLKRPKIAAIIVILVFGLLGAGLIYRSQAADCRNANLTPFMSGSCVQWVKGMVNALSGSNLDTSNPGFYGPLHQQLKNLNAVGIFAPHTYGDGTYAKLTPEKYDKLEYHYCKKNKCIWLHRNTSTTTASSPTRT